jgi:hypothetical protein
LKWEGYFALGAVAKPGNTPEQVEQALYKEIEKLQKEKVGERELQKVKNRFAADNFRRLQSNFALMIQLLLADSNRGWRTFNEDPQKFAAVTAEDVQRVANLYLKPENRTVALYYTKKTAGGEEDPLLTGLSEEQKAQVRQFRGMLAQMPADQAKAMLQKIEQGEGSAPPEQKDMLQVIKKLLQQKIEKGGK